MRSRQSSRMLGALLAAGSICFAIPQEISQGIRLLGPQIGEVPQEQSPYEEIPYNDTPHEDSPEELSPYGQPLYEKPSLNSPAYERDPAISIIEWEVGSPALYTARSVDDPDACPKGTGRHSL
ncbi:hypothetical protein BDP55DRAFT_717189 [Colletotrichum godetiae]|uniref:Uncharacterized protein n=1 Tax=Colletotrichum godetiae TaxID=1209918 RepID=A0AAJ0EVX4_9PEZI|nr:uncharacterized protein BDP55DRAFT_717189 [Colletotrichum godetiae]KAK1673659.1 hypothetical protein BDP55DRAFT_717189 [Colletotrichum godetiae]